ncbi:MAG: hypothetical protein GPJ54_17560, partial [Candidatus Heimdallarchaeota archaeon]|nr:hypothetical protein [Candidatus Heimdallarchaeota archaeon]
NKLEFGERYIGDFTREYGSTSMSFGGGGIFKIINDLGTKYNVDALLEFGSKAKNYVTGMYKNIDGNLAIYDKSSFSVETNPMRGLSGSLLFLSSFTEGIFELSSNILNFGSLETGKSLEKSITLKNTGEGALDVFLGSTSAPFDSISQNITLDGLEEYLFNVTFTPTIESIVDDELVINVGIDVYVLDLTGIGFDTPTFAYEAPDNGSLLTDAKIYFFVITATDSSGLDDVTMTIRNENETAISSTQLPIVDGTYKGSWDTNGYSNGTYIIDFELVDTLGHSSSFRLVYNIGFYTSKVEEVIFSEQTLYGIIGGIAVFLVVAVVITWRIKSKA